MFTHCWLRERINLLEAADFVDDFGAAVPLDGASVACVGPLGSVALVLSDGRGLRLDFESSSLESLLSSGPLPERQNNVDLRFH